MGSKRKMTRRFLKQYKLLTAFLCVGALVFLGVRVGANWPKDGSVDLGIPKVSNLLKPSQAKEEPKYVMPLSGVKVYNEALTRRRPVAVSIENSPSARPQSGLDKADVVYETPAEGGITRFLAFFQQNEPNEIGPVRSARTYFIDWLLPYDAFFVHVGGSSAAYKKIAALSTKEVDELRGANPFWRDNSRYAPHNDYTSYAKVKSWVKQRYGLDYAVRPYLFKEDAAKEKRPQSQSVSVSFSGPLYKVTWKYDSENNVYLRSIAGSPHMDRVTSKQLQAKTVVVQEVIQTATNNTEQHTKQTVGSGRATVFMDGQKVVGTWKKASSSSPTLFYDANGQEISFNRGQIWFEVITQFGSLSVS